MRASGRVQSVGGIVADDRRGTITFKLTTADPDFLHKLALPFAYATAPGAPDHDIGRRPLPATGPYMITGYRPGHELRLIRNPMFRPWSTAARPDGYADEIVWKLGVEPERAVTAIQRGEGGLRDLRRSLRAAGEPAPRAAHRISGAGPCEPRARGALLQSSTRASRRSTTSGSGSALNYAIDRDALVEIDGGPEAAQPTCQALPPGIPGYRRYCPYAVRPIRAGTYGGPDLAKAQQELVRASGTAGMRIRVVTDPHLPDTAHIVSVLRKLGYRASARPIAGERYTPVAANSRHRIQISAGGLLTQYPAPSQHHPAVARLRELRARERPQREPRRVLRPTGRRGDAARRLARDVRPRGREAAVGEDRPCGGRPGAVVADRQPERRRLRLRAGRQLPVPPAVGHAARPALGEVARPCDEFRGVRGSSVP